MCISSSKNMITGNARMQNLTNYIFVGLTIMSRTRQKSHIVNNNHNINIKKKLLTIHSISINSVNALVMLKWTIKLLSKLELIGRIINQQFKWAKLKHYTYKDTNRTTQRYFGVLYLFLSWLIMRILARQSVFPSKLEKK